MPPPPRNLPGPSRGWGHSAYAQARFHPWLPRAPRHRPPTLRTVATWTVVEADRSVGWVSRLPENSSPVLNVAIPRPISQSLFRGRLLSDRHPQEPPSIYTAKELRRLCPYCRVPQIHVPTHLAGALHRDCMAAAIAAASAFAGPPN
ncbi:hypothetical protein HPB48_000747 [Haemaphysalis longicornis]|uniref:Uncharacterized protein n=1 Tax=Haemaphysalis longicornis TaxID=44386 RepID=A0A9J6GBK5_HAELO|nr:hypothetical protein HPB48_000747 [Haemaphysalis longicornis]